MSSKSWTTHDFYCMCCGTKGIPVPRAGNKMKQKFHRKRMYCLRCRTDTNHIECRNEKEVTQFLEDFKNGVYLEEAKETMEYVCEHPHYSTLCNVRTAGIW